MLRAWACCVMTRYMRDFQLLSLHACKEVCGPAKACVQIQVTPAKTPCHGLGVAGSECLALGSLRRDYSHPCPFSHRDELRSPFGLFAPCPAPDVQCCRGGCSAGDGLRVAARRCRESICAASSRDDPVTDCSASAEHRHSCDANSLGECLCQVTEVTPGCAIAWRPKLSRHPQAGSRIVSLRCAKSLQAVK